MIDSQVKPTRGRTSTKNKASRGDATPQQVKPTRGRTSTKNKASRGDATPQQVKPTRGRIAATSNSKVDVTPPTPHSRKTMLYFVTPKASRGDATPLHVIYKNKKRKVYYDAKQRPYIRYDNKHVLLSKIHKSIKHVEIVQAGGAGTITKICSWRIAALQGEPVTSTHRFQDLGEIMRIENRMMNLAANRFNVYKIVMEDGDAFWTFMLSARFRYNASLEIMPLTQQKQHIGYIVLPPNENDMNICTLISPNGSLSSSMNCSIESCV
jgi:hypothetical protein